VPLAGFGSLGIGDFTDGNTIDVIVEPDTAPARMLASIDPFYRRPTPHNASSRRSLGRG
jgi:hypothetical protein